MHDLYMYVIVALVSCITRNELTHPIALFFYSLFIVIPQDVICFGCEH